MSTPAKKLPWTKPTIKPKPEPKSTWRNARPTTFGDVLGEAISRDRAEKDRVAELERMGFKRPQVSR